MQVADLSSQIDSWNKEIDEITKLVEQWESSVIYIDVDQNNLDSNKKYQQIMRKWDVFKQNIENRLQGLRNKIVEVLKKIYNSAMDRLGPYKALADLATFSGDLGAVVGAIKSIGSFFLAAYTELLETITAITTLVTQVISLTSKLANLSAPKIVLRDNTNISLPPPKWEPISMSDITG